MFAIPFGRIFWKEYRTNRALWLACLLIGVLIQFITWVSLRRPLQPSVLANGLLAQAVFMPFMYAIGCGAVMFASEREDGTSDWLLTLSVPRLPMLLGKTTFAIISTIVLQLVMVICSMLFLAGVQPDTWWPSWVPFGLLALIWTCLGSLVSRRVLTSVFAAAGWLILLAFVLEAMAEYFRFTYHGDFDSRWRILWCMNGFVTFAVDCWLGWRWCHGEYLDGTVLETFVSGISFVSNKLLHRSAEPDRLPLRMEYDQSWRRTWQRLTWVERHRSKLPWALLQIVCAMSVVLIPVVWFSGERSGGSSLLWACIWLSCGITPIAMGWLAFQVDSSLQQPRFLANRGISYGSLWLAKQYVWLPRAIFFPLVMSIFSIVCLCVVREGDRRNVLHRVLVESAFARPQDDIYEFVLGCHRVIWFVLLTYGCGQLASLLFRRTIFAILVSVFFCCIILTWNVLIELCQLSVNGAMAFPFIALMFITLWQMQPWLLEDQTWVRGGKLAASLIGIPIVLALSLCGERVRQVYVVPHVAANVIQMFDELVRMRTDQMSNSPPCKPVLDQLDQLLRDDAVPDDPGVVLELIEQNQSALNTIDFERPGEYGQIQRLCEVIGKRSIRFLEEGRLVESLTYHLANLKLSRAIGHGDVYSWQMGVSRQSNTLENLILWANHPDQTEDSVLAATDQIATELRQFPSCTMSFVETYIHDRKLLVLSSSAELLERVATVEGSNNVANLWGARLFLLPSERMRNELLLSREAELNYELSSTLETEFASPQIAISLRNVQKSLEERSRDLEKLEKTTPLWRDSSKSAEEIERMIKMRFRSMRTAMTRLHLIAYRLKHGNLPDSLVQLLPVIKNVDLIDPFTGRMFDYYPHFLFSPGPSNYSLVPMNPTELTLIAPRDAPIQPRPDETLRIKLDEPINIDGSKADSTLSQICGRGDVTFFPIPARSVPVSE